ncbi:unnamed protein product [Lactuca saligna]|uniref:Uncharacterized protein n=1 Tax=Lactuca saligna TaxID=75948 RepID=A0AA36EEL7_LACSI|nr:unnamed protein product [Lactuca saligna]
MASLVESCFKILLDPILYIVLRLPTKAPRPSMLVSQWGDKGCSSKYGGKDKGKVVWKGLNINEGGLGSSTIKLVATSYPNGKGKGVQLEPSEEEKKRLRNLETEKMKQLNIIMRMRANVPHDLNK